METKTFRSDSAREDQIRLMATKPFYRVPEVFVVNRTVPILEEIFIWMASTDANHIKFDWVSSHTKISESKSEADGVVSFEDIVPKTMDLLYGFRFVVSVNNFRLWMSGSEGTSPVDIVNLVGTNKSVREIRFDTPVPILPYFELHLSYTTNPKEVATSRMDLSGLSQYKVLNPCFTLGYLQEMSRNELHDSLIQKRYQPIDNSNQLEETKPRGPIEDIEKTAPTSYVTQSWIPINVKPTVILRDGSIYDKNVIELDLQGLTK